LPTVTDAHAVIGTLAHELFKGTGIEFKRDLAVAAIRRHIADPYGWSIARAAYAIIDIAVANMAEMVRLATTRRGLDPRNFAILASGGAGPLHASAVGEQIGATEIIVPPYPGMFSAFGATLGFIRHELTQTFFSSVQTLEITAVNAVFEKLRQRANAILDAEPQGIAPPNLERFLEARFAGQLFELKMALGRYGEPLPNSADIEISFRKLYFSEYGFDLPDAQVQVVNLRLTVEVDLGHRGHGFFDGQPGEPKELCAIRVTPLLSRSGDEHIVPVYRAAEGVGAIVKGPAIIEHSGSTVWILDRQVANIGSSGQVTVKLSGGPL
jgi:N-methylhydantoinase A